ncbi:hypothetical protein ACQKKX_06705 [Neorhizobium sp. NPDC001467]|uniref:hypothetical protein n=1 Tax=Neorhizobium sp. NPDC001467 TaxID=3390595 RepID=UPI003D04C814
MTTDAADPERFLTLVAAEQGRDPTLTSIQAAMVVAARLGIAGDSRSFARILDIEHALTLRELNALADRGDIIILKRDERTLRTFYRLAGDVSAEAKSTSL